ncbi:hypothetical protein B0H13DRAFT_218302 [Mycena leptocephala]|nr:hypothetical protein B0H13DRAFT_218302 [Mycena leptocephala]
MFIPRMLKLEPHRTSSANLFFVTFYSPLDIRQFHASTSKAWDRLFGELAMHAPSLSLRSSSSAATPKRSLPRTTSPKHILVTQSQNLAATRQWSHLWTMARRPCPIKRHLCTVGCGTTPAGRSYLGRLQPQDTEPGGRRRSSNAFPGGA